jgi:TolB protein
MAAVCHELLAVARIVMAMDDVPPPEAFEPAPDAPPAGGRWRRWLQIAVILILIASLIVLAAVQGGLVIERDDQDNPTVREAVVPRLAVVTAAGALSTIDDRGGSILARDVPGVVFQFPAWSPDGTQLAAIGQGPRGTGVYVFDAGPADLSPTEPDLIYESAEQPPFYLYWTPDSTQVTFLTSEADGLALRMAPADGTGSAYVVRSGSPLYWDFVDSARLLVHSGARGFGAFFGEVGADGGRFEGTDRATGVFRAPAVSASGQYRAYLAADGETVGEVVREARNGSGATRIRVFGTAAMSFGPVDDELAFVALDQPATSTLPLPVGPLRLLGPGASDARTIYPGSAIAFFWSPTGEQIAVLDLQDADDNATEADVGRVALASTAREAAAGLILGLVFVDVRSGSVRSERAVRLSSLFINQVLPFFDQYALSHRFWSPDGSAIALPLVGAGDVTELTVIPADGGEPRVVATAEMGFWNR